MGNQEKEINRVRKMKEKLLRELALPSDALPGSLSMSRLQCGKERCRCNRGKRHEAWTLTYMSGGKKRVQHIPQDLLHYVSAKVQEGKAFKAGINEIFSANAKLLVLFRKHKQRT